MAIAAKGIMGHPHVNGGRTEVMCKAGQKFYQDYIAVNTILATWGYDDNANNSNENPVIPLSQPISKLKNGITLYYDKWYEDTENGGQIYYRRTGTNYTVSFTKAQLKIGVSISFTPTDITGANAVYVKAVSDTQLQVGMYIGAGAYNDWYWIQPRKIIAN